MNSLKQEQSPAASATETEAKTLLYIRILISSVFPSVAGARLSQLTNHRYSMECWARRNQDINGTLSDPLPASASHKGRSWLREATVLYL